MVIVFIVSIISVLFAYLSGRDNYYSKTKLQLSFWGITLLQMIHYDYGHDYMGYYEDHLIYSAEWDELLYLRGIKHGAFKDMGWVIINKLLPGEIGFYILVAIISVVQSYIIYVFIRDFVEKRQRWKALAIYLFTTSLYVMSFSAMRQALAVSLCVLSFMYATKEKYIQSVIVVLFAFSIHSSAIVMIPFLLLPRLKMRQGKLYALIIIVGAFVLYIGTPLVLHIYARFMNVFPILSRNYAGYIDSMGAVDGRVGLGWLLNSIVYFVIIWFIYHRFGEFTKGQQTMLLLVCVSFCLVPFSLYVSGIISRLETYFSIFEVAVIPLVYPKIRDKLVRSGVSIIYIFMMLYSYYNFFFVTKWSAESYSTFKTVFSVF